MKNLLVVIFTLSCKCVFGQITGIHNHLESGGSNGCIELQEMEDGTLEGEVNFFIIWRKTNFTIQNITFQLSSASGKFVSEPFNYDESLSEKPQTWYEEREIVLSSVENYVVFEGIVNVKLDKCDTQFFTFDILYPNTTEYVINEISLSASELQNSNLNVHDGSTGEIHLIFCCIYLYNDPGHTGGNDDSMDIDQREKIEIGCYPNPFLEKIILKNIKEGDVIKIYNSLGENVYQGIIDFDGRLDIETSDYNIGNYFVLIIRKEKLFFKKQILKERV